MTLPFNLARLSRILCTASATVCLSLAASAQNASVPAGALNPPAQPTSVQPILPQPTISPKQAREADDAYLEGARQLDHKDLAAAERSFARAVQLNPTNRDYALALLVARENRITELVQLAAAARKAGNTARSEELLSEARKLDPDNAVIAQHFNAAAPDAPTQAAIFSDLKLPGNAVGATLGSPVELTPDPGVRTFNLTGSPQTLLSQLYAAFGIKTTFDSTVSGPTATLNLKDVDFATATRIAFAMTHTFAVAIQPKTALLARDNAENRNTLEPQVEEALYFPGVPAEQMTELANVARNIFDIKQVTASATGGDILLRGDAPTLRLLNATYADMLDGGSDVVFDVHLYEVSKTNMRNIGAQLPSSAGVFSIAAEAQSLITANQSILSQAIAAGLLTLNGTPLQNELKELAFLVASGSINATQFTGLLGTFGGGLTYAGLFLGSSSSFNLALTSSDVRTLDDVQLRSSNRQPANFRAGTRYPVVTATYSSGVSSSLASQLAGLNINGTSASSLLSQYLGSSTASIPQFQFEDLGLTLNITPQIQHGGDVQLALEMKLEALAGGTINSIPILNNRTLSSTITVPVGKTAMLATLVSKNEIRSVDGLPYLSELPGFQGTDKSVEKDSDELLITITPHIVRSAPMRIASRPLLVPHTTATPQ